ncbi:Ent-kaurene oxidase [Cytospora mali]|uniref:Ent-kaurene oxidase n=1 Tax=Cytospora mali TaxID=578113 RepID=A0A194UWE4_CYTMA|nr:Ent-kaurene oxidase [Valsa mali var. pyri (nom. inval.)]
MSNQTITVETPSTGSTAVDLMATQWPYVATTIIACAAALLIQKLFAKGVFRIITTRNANVVVVNPKFLGELKNLPDDTVSFSESVKESMQTKYTNVRADRPIIPHIVKKDLTPALNRLNPTIAEEVDQSFQEELPPCKDFTPVNINNKLLRIVAKVSGRIFIGPELCRSEEYIDAAINYTMDVVHAQRAVMEVKPWQRWLKAPGLPQVKALQTREQAAKDYLRPIIEARQQEAKENPDYQKPDDLLQWLLDGQDKFGEQDIHELAAIQLGLTFAAIHTTSMTATNAFYTVAAMPEIIPELREEIRTVLQEYGTFTTAALQKMKKLDSFLRETMRVYPLSWTSFSRKVLKTFTLSNGQVIPAGCIIEVPAYGLSMDDQFNENPEEFDAFRSYRAREQEGLAGASKAGAAAANQFVTVSPSNLTFGYGRHACPGRFFAANEIKMIVSRALLDYDITMVDGARERYANLQFGTQNIPDGSKDLLFKRIV